MRYRHEITAIISATALAGGPLTVLGEVLDRRARAGAGLTPHEVQAAARLIAAARHITALDATAVSDGVTAPCVRKAANRN